jgi:hypothetical protein
MSNPVMPGFNQRWRKPGFFLFSDKAGYLIDETVSNFWIKATR